MDLDKDSKRGRRDESGRRRRSSSPRLVKFEFRFEIDFVCFESDANVIEGEKKVSLRRAHPFVPRLFAPGRAGG